MSRKINCSQCSKEVKWSKGNDYRPFCSERCRLLDLGAWASGRNKIKGSRLLDNEEDLEETTKH